MNTRTSSPRTAPPKPVPLPLISLLLMLALGGLGSLSALVMGGCTPIPTREFTDYRAAFVAARAAGEEVLLDADLALKGTARLTAAREQIEAARADPLDVPDRPRWSREAALAQTTQTDLIAVRMKAWAALAAWNDALVPLAEGKPAQELGTSFDTLSDALTTFPWEALGTSVANVAASAGGAIGPAVEVIRTLIVEAQREHDRRKFIAAIEQAAPIIQALIDLLGEDADDFWRLRHTLYSSDRLTLLDRLQPLAREARTVAATGTANPPPETTDAGIAIARIDAALVRLREFQNPAWRPVAATAGDPHSSDATSRLVTLAATIERDATEARTLDQRLDDYEAALTAYARLLVELDRATRALQRAAASAQPEAPDLARLADLTLHLRRAVAAYRHAE